MKKIKVAEELERALNQALYTQELSAVERQSHVQQPDIYVPLFESLSSINFSWPSRRFVEEEVSAAFVRLRSKSTAPF